MTRSSDTEQLVSFEVDGETLSVRDEQEGHELQLQISATEGDQTSGATGEHDLAVQQALPDLFPVPVDAAVSVRAHGLEIGAQTSTSLRDVDGNFLGDFGTESISYPRGTYFVEISAGVKTYVRVPEVALTAEQDHYHDQDAPMRIEFDGPTTITVGARSLHSAPRATITLPDDPAAWIEAFPYLASSIKEFSPERAWPTLRGHPPAIERGDVLDIPDLLTKPETGVTVGVPATFADLYRVAPLVFYLGADLVAADSPEIRLANGYVEPLPTEGSALEEHVADLVSRFLLLDALVRNDGYHDLDALYEYDEVARDLPFYPPELYDESLTSQLMEYLEVSSDVIDPHRPPSQLEAVLQPDPADVELLPTLLDDCAAIRVADTPAQGITPDPAWEDGPIPQATAYTGPVQETGAAKLVKRACERAKQAQTPMPDEATVRIVLPEPGSGGRRADREDTWNDVITYLVEETDARRENVERVVSPTRAELVEVLSEDHACVYCGLRTADGGIECADGVVDPGALDAVGARGLLFQGPRSVDVAETVTERGAVVGIGTSTQPSPWTVGHLLRAIFRGHHVFHATRFAEYGSPATYRVVGVPTSQLVRRAGDAAPIEIQFVSRDADEHHASIRFFPTDTLGAGSVTKLIEPFAREAYNLMGRSVEQPLACEPATVVNVLADDDYIVWINGTPYHGEREPTKKLVREYASVGSDRSYPQSRPNE